MQPVKEDIDSSDEQEELRRTRQAEDAFWTSLGRLYRWRRFLLIVTALSAVAAVVISLLLPNWYRASARLLIPEPQGTALPSAILGNLPGAAAALLGGRAAGDYTRYLAILTSRSVMTAAVESFDLIRVYDLEGKRTPLEDALKRLGDNTDFDIDLEYDFLSISVLDKDPQRAADMANFFVRTLNEINMRLTAESAGSYRRFIEHRFWEARAAMDSVLDATMLFQKEHGVFDLPAQTQAFFEQVATLRQNAVEAEVRQAALMAQYGPDNTQVHSMGELARAANRIYDEAMEGRERLLPIPQSAVPDVARRYVQLELETTIQRTILEVLGPLFEQARLQEERETQAVQVVDEAIPPAIKAKPKRSVICIVATLSAFLLAVIFVLVYEAVRHNHRDVLRRLQGATSER